MAKTRKQILLGVANLIAERGLGYAEMQSPNGQCCVLGAIVLAAQPGFDFEGKHSYILVLEQAKANKVAEAFAGYLARNGLAEKHYHPNDLWMWNDGRVDETKYSGRVQTTESVVEALRACAAEL